MRGNIGYGYIGFLGSTIKRDVNLYGTKTPVEIFNYLLRNLRSISAEIGVMGSKSYGHNLHSLRNRASPTQGKQAQNVTNQNSEKEQPHGMYGRLYKKYQELAYTKKSRVKETYASSVEKLFKRLRSVYQGNGDSAQKKEPYSPFRKPSLTGKVLQFSRYLTKPTAYQTIKRPEYARTIQNKNDGNQEIGGLEQLLAA